MPRTIHGLLAALVALAACAQGGPEAVVASAGGSIGVGESRRVLFSIVDFDSDEVLASPERTVTVALADENGSPLDSYDTEFIWAVEDERGVYAALIDVPEAATYRATLEVEDLGEAGPVGIVVVEDPRVVQPGEPGISSDTRTLLDDPDLSSITSDPNPDPDFYSVTVAEAIGNGAPTVVVFGSPKWCVSETCGLVLDIVKSLAPEYQLVDFIHVETYDHAEVGDSDDLVTVPAVEEWGLPSEPWVFVADRSGTITASFEGVVSAAELSAALDAVTG